MRAWQRYHDVSRGKRRIRRTIHEDEQERRRLLQEAALILKDVNGVKFVLYPYDRPNVLRLVRHPDDVAEFGAIQRLVRPGDTAFDVGANLGFYTVFLSRLCGRVWAFEPVPETYWRLRETLALNRCPNVTAVQTAVCETAGTTRMNLFDQQFCEWNSLGKPLMSAPGGIEVEPCASIEVRSCNLDDFCDAERVARIDFLKVDVEGFELFVFRGATRLLKQKRLGCVCFEVSRAPLKGAGVEVREVFQILEAHGYFTYRLDKKTGKFHGPIRDTSEEWTNFFASATDLACQ